METKGTTSSDVPNEGTVLPQGSGSPLPRLDEEQFALVAELTDGGLWSWSAKGKEIRYAGAWYDILGYEPDELPSSLAAWLDLLHPGDRGRIDELFRRRLLEDDPVQTEAVRIRHRDGSFRSCNLRARVEWGADRRRTAVIGSVVENTSAALADPLTGLPNRAILMERLQHALERFRRNPENTFAVLFLDLNNFKVTNDSLGHHIGDLLLIEMARRLQFCVRGSDTVARLGGDEFVVLVEGFDDRRHLEVVVNRIARYTDSTFTLDGYKVQSSASIGVVWDIRPYANIDEILRDADIAMYHAKENKEGNTFFDTSMLERAVERQRLEIDLREAMELSQFRLVFQPIVDLRREKVAGYEALLRWDRKGEGPVPPETFVRIAEETGLIIPLGEWVLFEACRALSTSLASGVVPDDAYVSVNVSSVQLSRPAFVGQVKRILKETGVPPGQLILEITESDIMKDGARAVSILATLKGLGLRIAVDDFGTGYSSLSYIHSLPLDLLKIDGSFVQRLESDPKSVEIVRTFVHLAHSLGLTTVSEGIETAAQAAILRSLACGYGQGFHLARPSPLP